MPRAASPKANPDTFSLAKAMRAERQAQGATLKQVAQRGGTSALTVMNAEKGQPLRPFTLAALDRGLGWAPGTAAGILAGTKPPAPGSGTLRQATPMPAPASDTAGISERLARVEGKLDALIAMVAAGRGTP